MKKTVNLLDEKIVKDAELVLDDLGLDFDTAIEVYLRQIILTQSIPFEIKLPDGHSMPNKNVYKPTKSTKHKQIYKGVEPLPGQMFLNDDLTIDSISNE